MLSALMITLRVRTLALLLAFFPAPWPLVAQEAAATAPASSSVAGIWLGTLHNGTVALRGQLRIQPAAGNTWSCALDSIDQKLFNLPCSDVRVNGGAVSFNVPAVQGRWEGMLSADGRTLSGTWTQGRPIPLVLERQTTAIEAPKDQDFKTEVLIRLRSQFTQTRFTADRTDIVKAGSVLVLQKDHLMMFSVDNTLPPTNTYRNGKLTMGFGTSLEAMKTGDDKVPQRTFVTGEKFWLAGTAVEDDGVYLIVISDPFNDVRYYSKLKFPYNRKSPPSADQVMNTVAEVVTLDSSSDQAAAPPPPQQPAAPAPASSPAPMAAIAPPPPPADAPPPAPKTIAIGQTKDMVVAILGQPQKVVKLNTKEIDIYPDLKITFINNKVSDVQ